MKLLRFLKFLLWPRDEPFKPARWRAVYRCPVTKQRVTHGEYAYSQGVCQSCGHVARGTFTHAEKSAEENS